MGEAEEIVSAQLASTLSRERDIRLGGVGGHHKHHGHEGQKSDRPLRYVDRRDFWKPFRSVR